MRSLSKLNPKSVGNVIREFGGLEIPDEYKEEVQKEILELFDDLEESTSLTVVKPEIHYLDEQLLVEMYDRALMKEHPDLYEKINKGEIARVPENLLSDIFQLHLNRTEDSKFNKSNFNQGSYKLVKSLNDEDMKVITNFSNMNSFITTKHIMFELQKQLDDMNEQPPQDEDENTGNDGLAEKLANQLSKGNSKGGSAIDQAKEQAKQEIQEMEHSSEMLEEMDKESGDIEDASGKQAGVGDGLMKADQMIRNKEMFSSIDMSNKVLSNMLTKSLESTVNYFTQDFSEVRQSLLDSDDISELLNVEYLIPELRVMIEEVETIQRKYKMGIDVYVDISGSMGSYYRFNGQEMDCLNLSKLITLKIASKNILKNIYTFNDVVHGPHKREKFLRAGLSGGTNIDNAIKHIISVNRPSVIITDACDSIYTYSDLAYFIALNGGSLSGNKDIVSKYKNQGIEYKQDNTFAPIRIRSY